MECNKEEAIRAKEIAEKKMQNKDFVGAQKMILRAQQLFPDLENISQMLTICEVHCFAEHKLLGSEMNWYGVLQVEQTADESSIKKQYRKLALILHPDKNKFAGAEAAFKLIGEGHRVLSDQAKRSIYDMKNGSSLRKQPQEQQNGNSYVRKQPGANNNFVNVARTQFTNVNPHQQQQKQQTQPGFIGQLTFWTECPFCSTKYQYYKDNILNRALRCQNCMQPFIAYDLDVQGEPPRANWSRSAIPQQKEVLSQGGQKSASQSTVGNFPSNMRFHGNLGSGATASEPFLRTGGTSDVGKGSRTKEEANGDANMEDGMKGKKRHRLEAEKHNTSRKRRKKYVVESSESCDTDSSTDTEEDEIIEEEGGLTAGQTSGFAAGRYPRRSAQQKQDISYNEDLSDEDHFFRRLKRSRSTGSSNVTEDQSEASLKEDASKTKEAADFPAPFEEDKEMEKQKGSALEEESLPNGNDKAEECKTNRKAPHVDGTKKRSEVDNKFKSNSVSKTKPNPEFFDVPDPEFYDFDKDRKEECFAVDQMWSVYDNLDGMPRFYARINKVFSPEFKLRITWLRADPDSQDKIDWLSKDLPFACGKFKHEKSEITEDLGMFSHLVSWEKGSTRSSYRIYPRKCETWALFKNWDIKWSPDPDNLRNYEYEFVEVLSDYVEGSGITVAYLVKMKGFVSLFRLKKGMISFQMPPNELFRFSHRVSSYRTTGTEREDVPEGYFELDPASVPNNLEEFADIEDLKVDIESMDAKFHGSCSKSQVEKMPYTLEKGIHDDENNTQDGVNSKGGNWFPRESNGGCTKQNQANLSQCVAKEVISKHLDLMKDSNHVGSTPTKERRSYSLETEFKSVVGDRSSSPLSMDPCDIPEPEFYNFDADKNPEKFQPGQIWALYCELDGLPKYYARINKIESSPNFKLHITWLEHCPPPKGMIQWLDKGMPICCGTFKLTIGGTAVYTDTSSFSHQSRPVSTGKKNKYEIYPRKGEVWALYKNFNSEWTCSDVDKCEYDMVEVLEDAGWTTEVLVLGLVDGFETVFEVKRKGGSAITMEIPRVELLKFSHKVPAFRLVEERGGSLRGCWELDPNSIPICLFCSN